MRIVTAQGKSVLSTRDLHTMQHMSDSTTTALSRRLEAATEVAMTKDLSKQLPFTDFLFFSLLYLNPDNFSDLICHMAP